VEVPVETVPLYDALSQQYDYFVNWAQRLEYELPFIERELDGIGAREVLDAACGTGMHAIALAQRGYRVTGADLSARMIDKARANAAAAGVAPDLVVGGFGGLAGLLDTRFDAVLCLGNSLPHTLTLDSLQATLADFAALLRPGGLLLIQSRNLDAVLESGQRWIGPQGRTLGDEDWLFVRFYDFDAGGTLTFNVLTLHRIAGGPWVQQVESTRLRPWRQAELESALKAAGMTGTASYGDMQGAPFEIHTSADLVLVTKRNDENTGHHLR
jgi:glycine/sarcosine N-methyltransferase